MYTFQSIISHTKRFIRNNFSELSLLVAIFVGSLLRIWRINDIPFPPNDSELFFGYYGWSLLHYQVDEFGKHWPMNFPSIGDFKYPGLAYLNILPAAIFGLSIVTVKFWSVFSGIILIPIIYLLSLLIFKNKVAAAYSSWLMALSPWGIILSRIGYENFVSVAFTTIGLTFLLLPFLKLNELGGIYSKISEHASKHQRLFLVSSLILFTISSFTYAAQRLFIPMILSILFVFSFVKESQLQKTRKTVLSFIVILTAIISISMIPWQNRGRTDAIIYNTMDASEANRQQELIMESGTSPVKTPVILTRLMVNKYRIMFSHLLNKYTNHFSVDYLFLKGDTSYERIPDTGQLLLIEIILLPLGIFALFKRPFNSYGFVVLSWLVIAPISSTITIGGMVNRASIMVPALVLISGLGVSFICSLRHKVKLLILPVIFIGIFFSAMYSTYQIFVIKPIHQPWYTETVNQQMVSEVLRIKDNYDAVAIPRDEYIFFLFYGKISPFDLISNSKIKPLNRQNPWDRVERYSNIYFNMRDCPSSGKENVLYLCKGQNVPQNSTVINVIRYRDGVPAYTFLTFYPISKMPDPLPTLPGRLFYMEDLESDLSRPDGMIKKDSPDIW